MTLKDRIRGRLAEIRTALPTEQGRELLRRRYAFDGLRALAPIVGVETPNGLMFLSTRDRTVARHVYMTGTWDPQGLPNALLLAQRHGFPGLKGRVFVEVGGNIGTTTLQAARIASRCVTLEPEPRNLALLRASVAANDLGDRVEVIAAAASNMAGSLFLRLSTVNDGAHRVAESGDIEVVTVLLDDVLKDRAISSGDIGLLWLDVEGHEARVLAGAAELLASPPVTVLEYSPAELRRLGDLDSLGAMIHRHWCQIIDLRSGDGAPESLASITQRYERSHTDLLLLP